jgi:hypothetical protein
MWCERPRARIVREQRHVRSSHLICVGVLWIALILSGFWLLGRERFSPVVDTRQAAIFPSGSDIQLASDKPTLLLFAHPQCPCTRATFHELDGLLEKTGNRVSVVVIFTIPDGVATGWEQGELWKSATTTPGFRVVRDQGGRETRRFGVTGSGHTLLYSPTGRLLFSGGITASRGHEGDNIGLSAVESFILHGHASFSRTPVFGCSLL